MPTPLGEKIVSGLCGHFSFIEYDFTRTMEQSLDDIAEGKAEYRTVISSAYDQLSKEVQDFAKATGKLCPKCGKAMVHRVKKPDKNGKGGYVFWGCTGWTECKETLHKIEVGRNTRFYFEQIKQRKNYVYAIRSVTTCNSKKIPLYYNI